MTAGHPICGHRRAHVVTLKTEVVRYCADCGLILSREKT
jgi:hypothetical protein